MLGTDTSICRLSKAVLAHPAPTSRDFLVYSTSFCPPLPALISHVGQPVDVLRLSVEAFVVGGTLLNGDAPQPPLGVAAAAYTLLRKIPSKKNLR